MFFCHPLELGQSRYGVVRRVGSALQIGLANPGPIRHRTDENNVLIFELETVQFVGHAADAILALPPGHRRRQSRQQGRQKFLQYHFLECIGIGQNQFLLFVNPGL